MNGQKPAKHAFPTQEGVGMKGLRAAGPHPARILGLNIAHEAPERQRRSPSCARRAGKGRVSGLGGRVGALKSRPDANLRAGMADIPNPPRGQITRQEPRAAGWRAREGAGWPAAMSQRPGGLFRSPQRQAQRDERCVLAAQPPLSSTLTSSYRRRAQRRAAQKGVPRPGW